MKPILLERRVAGVTNVFVCGRGLAAVGRQAMLDGNLDEAGNIGEPLVLTADVLGVCGEAHQPNADWDGMVADAAEAVDADGGASLVALVEIASDCLDMLTPVAALPEISLPDIGTDEWHDLNGGARVSCFG